MANITRFDPVTDLFDDLFKGFFVRPVMGAGEGQPMVQRMKIEVSEQKDSFKVRAELPGVKKEDIQINVDGDQVSISAEVKQEKEVKEGERVVHSERYYGKVARVFRLGTEVDEANADAKFVDGMLELTLPKKAAAKAKQISIK